MAQPPAQLPAASAIDSFLKTEFKVLGSPGMAVAIVQNGKVVYAKGFGFADLQNDVPVETNTVFRLGSITKQFTATMVMQLVQEGKLSLDDTLGTVLPTAPKAWSAVTIRQLLSHTAGIPNYTNTPDFGQMVRRDVTVEHINDNVIDKRLDFPAGSKWNYSNSGYILLGQIIEKVTGKTYAEELHRRILDPLGMTQTYFVRENEVIKHRAYGYSITPSGPKQSSFINMVWPFAAGSMESTVLDLAKWDAALYGDKILPQAALKSMWTPTKLTSGTTQNYGFGWSVETLRGILIVSHGGGIPGFTTFIERAPSVGLTVIALTNTDSGAPEGLVRRLVGFVDHRLAPDPIVVIEDKDPTLTARLRAALVGVLSGKADPAIFAPNMLKLLTPQLLASFAEGAKSLGPLKAMNLTKSEDKDGVKTRDYQMVFANATLAGHFEVDKSGLISNAQLH